MRTITATAFVLALLTGAAGCGLSANILTTISTDSGFDSASEEDLETDSDSDYPSSADSLETTDSADTDADSATVDDSEDDSSEDDSACPSRNILPSEVLLIGDSWISMSCDQVGGIARAAGVLDVNEDYICRAEVGKSMDAIIGQYNTYVGDDDEVIKVVIMNGGAVDTYGPLGTLDSVNEVVGSFRSFLSGLADAKSVEQVIYVLYADVLLPQAVDFVSPMAQECAASEVPCLFLELQPLWEGNPHYTSGEGVNPSPQGAAAIANAIWDTMTELCIAQ